MSPVGLIFVTSTAPRSRTRCDFFSIYTSIWPFAWMWFPFRRRIKPLAWWAFALLLLPIVMDGGTHAIGDLAGIGQGFHDTNVWLATLTNHSLPGTLYTGDAPGSFNSIMRFSTGLLAGVEIVWLAFPYIFQTHVYHHQRDERSYAQVVEQIKRQNPHPTGR